MFIHTYTHTCTHMYTCTSYIDKINNNRNKSLIKSEERRYAYLLVQDALLVWLGPHTGMDHLPFICALCALCFSCLPRVFHFGLWTLQCIPSFVCVSVCVLYLRLFSLPLGNRSSLSCRLLCWQWALSVFSACPVSIPVLEALWFRKHCFI